MKYSKLLRLVSVTIFAVFTATTVGNSAPVMPSIGGVGESIVSTTMAPPALSRVLASTLEYKVGSLVGSLEDARRRDIEQEKARIQVAMNSVTTLKTPSELKPFLKDRASRIRVQALNRLSAIASPQAVLNEALKMAYDENIVVRIKAINLIGEHGTNDALSTLNELKNNTTLSVRDLDTSLPISLAAEQAIYQIEKREKMLSTEASQNSMIDVNAVPEDPYLPIRRIGVEDGVEVYENPYIKTLAQYVEEPRGMIYVHPLLRERPVLMQAEVMHERVHHYMRERGFSPQLEDAIASAIELRMIIAFSQGRDKDIGLPQGTSLGSVVTFLKEQKDVRFFPLLRQLRCFKSVSTADLGKQLESLMDFAEIRHNGAKVEMTEEDVMPIVREIEHSLLKIDIDEKLNEVREDILSDLVSEVQSLMQSSTTTRAVIMDGINLDELDDAIVEKLLENGTNTLYVRTEDGIIVPVLYSADSDGLMFGESLVATTISNAVKEIYAEGTEVCVISPDEKALRQIDVKDVYMISTKRIKASEYASMPFEMLMLPFAFMFARDSFTQYSGVDRLFMQKGKLLQLNVDHIAMFGVNMDDAFARVMDNIKLALGVAQMQRAVQVAA